jgi:integrase
MSVRKRVWKTSKGEMREAFIVDYVDQSGARHIETFDRKGDAVEYQAKVKVDIHKGTHSAPSKSITVAEAAEVWIKRVTADGAERSTLLQYRQHIDLHILPLIGKVKLAHLSQEGVEKFRDNLLEKLSRPMARKVLSSFKSILRASKRGHVADDVKIKRNSRTDATELKVGRDIPTPAEIKRLVDAARPGRQRALVMVAVTCGLRASELRGLRWSDVNLKASTVTVGQRADRYGKIGAPKSQSSKREVPLVPQALSELKVWFLACPKTEADLVFPTGTGRIEHHTALFRGLKLVMAKANIVDKNGKPKYGVHALRHFFASWCLNRREDGGRELPPKEVQTLMGHSSIVMTMDIYGHLFPRKSDGKELADAATALLA